MQIFYESIWKQVIKPSGGFDVFFRVKSFLNLKTRFYKKLFKIDRVTMENVKKVHYKSFAVNFEQVTLTYSFGMIFVSVMKDSYFHFKMFTHKGIILDSNFSK